MRNEGIYKHKSSSRSVNHTRRSGNAEMRKGGNVEKWKRGVVEFL
jgi:hypothetical protein